MLKMVYKGYNKCGWRSIHHLTPWKKTVITIASDLSFTYGASNESLKYIASNLPLLEELDIRIKTKITDFHCEPKCNDFYPLLHEMAVLENLKTVKIFWKHLYTVDGISEDIENSLKKKLPNMKTFLFYIDINNVGNPYTLLILK